MSTQTTESSPATSATKHSADAGFPWQAFAAAFGVFLTGHWFATALYHGAIHFAWLTAHPGWLALTAGVGTILLARWLRIVHHHHPHPKPGAQVASEFALGVGVLVCATGTAYAGESWLEHGKLHLEDKPSIFLLATAAGLAIFSYLLSLWQPLFERPLDVEPRPPADRLKRREPDATEDSGVRALVLFISTPSVVPDVAADGAAQGWHVELPAGKGKDPCRLSGASPGGDELKLTECGLRWNWQQLLRAVKPHHHLQSVWLIGSKDSADYQPPAALPDGLRPELKSGHPNLPDSGKGSEDYLELCARFLSPYVPGATVKPAAAVPDFEDFNALVKAIRALLNGELKSAPRDQILLDVTGGQKVTSIAGAALTLGNEIRFQYVQTAKPFAAIRYDLMPDRIPSPHGH